MDTPNKTYNFKKIPPQHRHARRPNIGHLTGQCGDFGCRAKASTCGDGDIVGGQQTRNKNGPGNVGAAAPHLPAPKPDKGKRQKSIRPNEGEATCGRSQKAAGPE